MENEILKTAVRLLADKADCPPPMEGANQDDINCNSLLDGTTNCFDCWMKYLKEQS